MTLLTRILLFWAMVIASMLIIIAVASVSHAAECEPPPKLFFIWDIGEPCPVAVVHHKRHHRSPAGKHAGNDKARHRTASEGSGKAVPKTVHAGASPATKWKNPEHEKLFLEFEDWRLFGKQ